MKTIAEQIYPQQFYAIEAIISEIQHNNLADARKQVDEYFDRLEDISHQPERFHTQLFLEALDSRLNNGSAVTNLYLVPDAGQQIRMFNFMAQKFPVVRRAQDITNAIYLDNIQREKRFVLLDIGIGTGQQAGTLIEQLVAREATVEEVFVIGIEPSADSMAKAAARFGELSQRHGIGIDFTGIQKTAEQLDEQDWDRIGRCINEARGKLLLNASFALHHTPSNGFRQNLFNRLKSLQPEVFVIIEPYGNYLPDDLMVRFRNAWHHYGLTFLAIDTIDASDEEKNTVKRVFFGRELLDVLGEGNRIEQYETSEMWLEKLVDAGFRPRPFTHALSNDVNPLIEIQHDRHYLGFNVKGHPIVGVICVN